MKAFIDKTELSYLKSLLAKYSTALNDSEKLKKKIQTHLSALGEKYDLRSIDNINVLTGEIIRAPVPESEHASEVKSPSPIHASSRIGEY